MNFDMYPISSYFSINKKVKNKDITEKLLFTILENRCQERTIQNIVPYRTTIV